MERDEVVRLARECGMFPDDGYAVVLERFAALVAAAAADRARQDYEREHCRHVVPLPDALRVMIDEAVAAEREACASVIDSPIGKKLASISGGPHCGGMQQLAAYIRARGAA